jgi:threonine dehydratase
MLEQYVKKILTSRVYDVAVETPLQTPASSPSGWATHLLKREDLQPVFSFKIRGAYNKLTQLSDEERARGVVTASAGNHAQGLALAAKVLGVKATIVMPKTTPEIKVEGVRSRGGKVVLHGDSFPEALAYSLKLVDEKGYVYIHPYDDPHTIAGQGTVAMEILRQHQAAGRDFRAGGRRRADRRYRGVREIPASGNQGHRRRAGRLQLPAGRHGRR